MILSCAKIAKLLAQGLTERDPLVVIPLPNLTKLLANGDRTSIDLRLGTWFVAPRPGTIAPLDISDRRGEKDTSRFTKKIFIPLARPFILHPQNFVLASTLEWIRLPMTIAASVVGKSSWGRRGLVIATATSVHPGFSGCLTLELANIGQVPIAVYPGVFICQLVLYHVDSDAEKASHSQFMGFRRPVSGSPPLDEVFETIRTRMESGATPITETAIESPPAGE